MPGESGNGKELLQAMEGQSDVSLIPDVHSTASLPLLRLCCPCNGWEGRADNGDIHKHCAVAAEEAVVTC